MGISFTIILSVAFFLLGIYITYLFSSRHKLLIEQIKCTALSPPSNKYGIGLSFEGQAYNNPILIYDLQIINRGNQDIDYNDIIQNINLIVPTGYSILKVVEPEDNPSIIGIFEQKDSTTIEFKLNSIKKSEKIVFQVFVLQSEYGDKSPATKPEFIIKGRIRDVKSIPYFILPLNDKFAHVLYWFFGPLALLYFLISTFFPSFRELLFGEINSKFLQFLTRPEIGMVIIFFIPVLIVIIFHRFFP